MNDLVVPYSMKVNRPHPRMSSKYGFVNSLEVARLLESEGWKLVSANARNSRSGNIYGLHWLRFRQPINSSNFKDINSGDLIPEIYFRNSHDGSSGVNFKAGLMRVVCSNGMVVEDRSFGALNLRHAQKNIASLKDSLNLLLDGFTNVNQRINEMKDILLTEDEQIEFAELAKKLRFGQHIPAIQAEKILQSRRPEDNGDDLWKVYNRIQENLSKGGLEGTSSTEKTSKNGQVRKIRTKELKDANRYLNFNSLLWRTAQSRLSGSFDTSLVG